MEKIDNIFDNAVKGLRIPFWAFKPDHWSLAFLRGLEKVSQNWEEKRVWEIGVGTGINLLVLRQITSKVEWYFSDYDERAVPLAIHNLGADRRGFNPLRGSWDLVSAPKDTSVPKVNAIFACIPQVPSKIDLSLEDRLAHYYDPTHYPEADLNTIGLGLCQTLLVKAKDALMPGGQVTLNLGGRPGLPRLKSLFKDAGYWPNIVWSETIPQHSETSLATLAALEDSGHDAFEFFTDRKGEMRINASEAEKLRLQKKEVYHNIYVIEGMMM